MCQLLNVSRATARDELNETYSFKYGVRTVAVQYCGSSVVVHMQRSSRAHPHCQCQQQVQLLLHHYDYRIFGSSALNRTPRVGGPQASPSRTSHRLRAWRSGANRHTLCIARNGRVMAMLRHAPTPTKGASSSGASRRKTHGRWTTRTRWHRGERTGRQARLHLLHGELAQKALMLA